MEYRIADYIISGQTITLPRKTGIEDIRLIYNETQKVLICSTSKKSNLGDIVVNAVTDKTLINVPSSVCVLNNTDKLTIKCDYGDNLIEVENKVDEGVETLAEKIDGIDLSAMAKESTLQEESAAIKEKIDNIKLPEIDTTELAKEATLNEMSNKLDNLNVEVEVDLSSVAKQGENNEATLSKVLEEIQSLTNRSTKYDSTTGNLIIENVNITIE